MFSDSRTRVQDARGKGGDDKHLDRETIVSRGASARGKERAHGVADSDVDGGRVARVCARQREEVRIAKGHRRVGAGTGKEREGSVREGKRARKRRR